MKPKPEELYEELDGMIEQYQFLVDMVLKHQVWNLPPVSLDPVKEPENEPEQNII